MNSECRPFFGLTTSLTKSVESIVQVQLVQLISAILLIQGYHIGDFDDARGPETFKSFSQSQFFDSTGVCTKMVGHVSAS